MRRIRRSILKQSTVDALRSYQAMADQLSQKGKFDPVQFWENRRRRKAVLDALASLRAMAGELHRCMYCVNSEAADIDHFWPKSIYHGRLFVWENFLLCCAICGRMKGSKFPIEDGRPLLIDPSSENPWDFLDFDPKTGNIVPRVDPATGDEFTKGRETVRILQLDRREAVARAYKKTDHRLIEAVEETIESDCSEEYLDHIVAADDHGLLGWYVGGTGRNEAKFAAFRERCPEVWANLRARTN